MDAHNVDATLVKAMQEQAAGVPPTPQPVPPVVSPPEEQENVPRSTMEPESKPDQETVQPQETESKSVEPEAKTTTDSTIDEYGNPVAPPKTYTEDEVQRMIRERLSRGRQAEQPSPQQVKQVTEDFKPDPNSEESWEAQLENFVEKTIEKREAKISEKRWREQESAKQADFEARFSSGMAKYTDFHQVLQPLASKGAIPDSVVVATRALDNPAAFLYGAAKLYPRELERIASLDRDSQAVEVGRLHEKMVKDRNTASAAPRPLDTPKSDVLPKISNQAPLDERINEYGKQKLSRR